MIPCVLGYYAARRKDIPFRGVVLLFVAFIVMCGTTHLMDAVSFWWPAYRLAAVLKFITAVISWATVGALFRVMPQMMALRSPAELEREISERHRAEGELRALHASLEQRVAERTALIGESEERFRAVFEATPSGQILAGRDGRIVLVNDLIVRMFGWPKAELVGQPVEQLLPERYREHHPAYRASYFAAPEARLMGGDRDLTGRRKDGTEFPVEVGLQPVDMAGEVLVLASVIDITVRKQAEADLRASEERLRAVFEATPSGLILAGRDGRIVLVNELIVRMFGWQKAELVGQPVEQLLPERYRERHPAYRDSYFAAPEARLMGGDRDLTGRRKDGTTFPVEVGLQPVDMAGEVLVLASVIDITVRKQAEANLRASEERFRAVIEAAPSGLVMAGTDGRIVLVNDLIVRMFGWQKAELVGQPVEQLLPERYRERHPAYRDSYFAAPEARLMGGDRDLTGRRKDGTEFPVEVGLQPVDMVGELFVLASVIDITVRKQAEADLRASEERFQTFMHHAPIAAWLVDEEFRGVYASPGYDRLTGLPPGTLLGRTASELFPTGVAARQMASSKLVQTTGHPVSDEEELVSVDGSPGVVYVVKFPVQGPSGRTLIGSVAIDITERKRAEELVKASLREKEVLLREIHHRVKNNLQIVSTLLDLQSGHTNDAAAIEMFQESRGRVKSMALIHERLYRAQDMARVDFGEYIRQLTDDLFQTYKVSGDIRLELELDIPPLTIDIAIPCGLLLNELISNCLKHAFAKTSGGCLRVTFFRKDGANILIVADDGVGFPADADFRNTKSFGLQLVNTLVEQLDGEISLATGPGTTFIIQFPKPHK